MPIKCQEGPKMASISLGGLKIVNIMPKRLKIANQMSEELKKAKLCLGAQILPIYVMSEGLKAA